MGSNFLMRRDVEGGGDAVSPSGKGEPLGPKEGASKVAATYEESSGSAIDAAHIWFKKVVTLALNGA